MRLITAALLNTLFLASASAQTVGLSVSELDTFRGLLARNIETAAAPAGLKLVVADAKGDEKTQIADVGKMIDSGASALVVLGVNKRSEVAIADLARAKNLPVVFVNHEPPAELLGGRVAYVGSDEKESGTLQTREICRLLGGKGNITVLMGELSHSGAKTRTHDVHDVLATPECRGIEILEEQSANWSREQAADITGVWLEGGLQLDAVIANNDNMALGAIDAIKAAGKGRTLVAGIDATKDALAAMQAGDLAVTVLQDAEGQGRAAIDLVKQLLKGGAVEPVNYVPFRLVTPQDAAALLAASAKS